MKNLPLLVAYFLYPAVNIVLRLSGKHINNNWIDVVWLLVLIVSLIKLYRKSFSSSFEGSGVKINFLTFILFFLSLKLLQTLYASYNDNISFLPFFMEIKPFAYLIIAL